MSLKLDKEAVTEVIKKCEQCNKFKVEKVTGMNPANTLQIGHCSVHGEVHSLDYSGFTIKFDSRKCGEDFKQR